MSVCLSVCLSVWLCVCRWWKKKRSGRMKMKVFVCVFVCLCLSLCLSVHLSLSVSMSLSFCVSVCLCVSQSGLVCVCVCVDGGRRRGGGRRRRWRWRRWRRRGTWTRVWTRGNRRRGGAGRWRELTQVIQMNINTLQRDTSSLRALTDTFQFFQSVQQQQSFRFVQGWKTGLKRRQFLGFKKTCGKKPRKFIFLGFLFFSCCAV